MKNHEPVELSIFIHVQTEKALLVSEDGDEGQAVWLPKSQLTSLTMDREGETGTATIEIPEWLAIKKGLI